MGNSNFFRCCERKEENIETIENEKEDNDFYEEKTKDNEKRMSENEPLIKADLGRKSQTFIYPKAKIGKENIIVNSFVKNKLIKKYTHYSLKGFVGKGMSGSVRKIVSPTGQVRAEKIILKKKLKTKKEFEEIKTEIEVLKKLDHPNIVKIYEFFSDDDSYHLITEYCEQGDLETIKRISGEKTFSEFLVKYIMYQIFLGVKYLHENGIAHGDLKTKNVAFIYMGNENESFSNLVIDFNSNKEMNKELLCKDDINELNDQTRENIKKLIQFNLKLIDFGSVDIFKKKKEVLSLGGKVITLKYLSPEGFEGNSQIERDEWACGVIMYYLLTGFFPFLKKTENEEIGEAIINNDLDINKLEEFSEETKSLLKELLNKNPTKRIKVFDVFDHPFFNKGIKIQDIQSGKSNIISSNEIEKLNKALLISRRDSKLILRKTFKQAVIAYISYNLIDKDEEKKVQSIFYKLCKGNLHSTIDKETFIQKFKEINPLYSEEELNNFFGDIDINKNGTIEYQELISGLSDVNRLLTKENLKAAFDYFDMNEDGKITWNEIEIAVFGGLKADKKVKDEFLKEIGQRDGNLSLSFEEFMKIIKS